MADGVLTAFLYIINEELKGLLLVELENVNGSQKEGTAWAQETYIKQYHVYIKAILSIIKEAPA